MKFFEVTPFDVRLTPASIAEAATTLTTRTGELERLIKTVD